jgi:5'-3' exonuclease
MNTKTWDDLAEVENIKSQPKSLLVIDGNNLAYRWLHRKNYNSFQDDYLRTLESLSGSYNAEKTIVCFDFGKSYYRMDLLDSYKGNRSKPKEEEEQKHYEEFFACLNDIPEMLPYQSLKFRGLEADDIITFLVMNLSDRYEHTWIVTSDRDMYQLLSDKVSIFNIFSRKEIDLGSFYETYELEPTQYLFSRILEGDKSDNIIGVEGVGPKRAQQLAKDYESLTALLSDLPLKGKSKYIQNINQSKDKLLQNEQLISLKKYNKSVVQAAKDGQEVWETLCEMVNNW